MDAIGVVTYETSKWSPLRQQSSVSCRTVYIGLSNVRLQQTGSNTCTSRFGYVRKEDCHRKIKEVIRMQVKRYYTQL
jgi:hypothetical protein